MIYSPSTPTGNRYSPAATTPTSGPKPFYGSTYTPNLAANSYIRNSPLTVSPQQQPGTPPEYLYSAAHGAPVQSYDASNYQHQNAAAAPGEMPQQPRTYVIYDEEEEQGPSTREIIANQSQDYVDERLAEYQMTIYQLQGELWQL